MKHLVLIACCMTLAGKALADSPALCSFSSGGTASPPTGQVAVTILSMKLNSDMEGEDDYIPGYNDRADVFGKVEINADGTTETFSLPKINESDYPHWSQDNKFVSRPATVGNLVHVVIRLRESDWNYDDTVDTSPNASRTDLEFDLDTCSMQVFGDITGSASGVFEVNSGSGGNQGVLRFQVAMNDGRALSTTGDVVLTGFDLIQVLPQVSRMVAQKPTVGLVTVTNNTGAPQLVSVRLRVTDEVNTVLSDTTESLGTALEVGEVRSKYLATNAPFSPTDFSCKSTRLFATATLILPPGAETTGDPKTACWLINNSTGTKTWSVVTTRKPSLTWIRTGALLDANALASMTQVNTMHDLAMPFIRGVYPAAAVDDSVSTFPLIPPLSGGVYAFVAALLTGLGVPADAVTPYLMVYELAADAWLAGIDRLMGVLPKAWFRNTLYGLWSSTTGLSLGEWMTHAVIFEVEGRNDDGTNQGPRLTLPGHELGHTYGLSLDPDIKSWACTLSGDIGVIACGIGGGFDEYRSDNHPDGISTWGYWVPQNSGVLASLTGEQCYSNCLMGPNSINPQNNWVNGNKEWIDPADYDHVIDKLKTCGPTSVFGSLYISGVIDGSDNAILGWTFADPKGRLLDFAEKKAETPTPYGIMLLDAKGSLLSEAELPLDWNLPETEWPIPATFFGGTISLPPGTAKIQVWNRVHKKLLVERVVTAGVPSVSTPVVGTRRVGKARFLDVSWSAKDPEGDALTHFVQVSPDRGMHWWPIAHALTKPNASVSLTGVRSGTYLVRVVTSDGVNVTMGQSSISL